MMLTKQAIETYFVAEKQTALLLLLIGVLTLITGIAGWLYCKNQFSKGIAIPCIVVACIQISVGAALASRSYENRVQIVYSLDMNPSYLQQNELPRMQKVLNNFTLYKYVELAACIAGIAFMAYGYFVPAQKWYLGIGVALAVQAVILLSVDFFAQKRAETYTQLLQQFVNQLHQ